MPFAREGLREILIGTLVLGGCATAGFVVYWPLALPFLVLWLWLISFFRDPRRVGQFRAGELCAPADGTVTEVTELDAYESIGGRTQLARTKLPDPPWACKHRSGSIGDPTGRSTVCLE